MSEQTLRKAKESDAEIIYQWQTHPRTRKFFRNTDEFSFESHVTWLKSKLKSTSFLYILVSKDCPVGFVRLDKVESLNGWEVSILISPSHYKKGYGSTALNLLRSHHPDFDIYAEVHPENRPSQRLFERTGYKLKGNYYISYGKN